MVGAPALGLGSNPYLACCSSWTVRLCAAWKWRFCFWSLGLDTFRDIFPGKQWRLLGSWFYSVDCVSPSRMKL